MLVYNAYVKGMDEQFLSFPFLHKYCAAVHGHSNYNIISVCRKKNVDDSMICVQYSLQHLNMHYTMFMHACMSY